MYLADYAWPELKRYFERESLALVPVGSTEQHGPHLPEATDALIAEGFARAAAERTGYLCTPTISVGVSPHHRNVEHLREVGRRLRDDHELYALEWMWDESISEQIKEVFDSPGPHGGPKETSLVWHLDSDLVHPDRLEQARDGGLTHVDGETGRVHGARTFYDSIDNTDNGVLGDQTDASPEIGAELFEAACDHLVELTGWLADQPFEELMPVERVSARE